MPLVIYGLESVHTRIHPSMKESDFKKPCRHAPGLKTIFFSNIYRFLLTAYCKPINLVSILYSITYFKLCFIKIHKRMWEIDYTIIDKTLKISKLQLGVGSLLSKRPTN